jgi:hypothetical protein
MIILVNEGSDVTGDKWITTMEHRDIRPVAWAKSSVVHRHVCSFFRFHQGLGIIKLTGRAEEEIL